ncbi:MAG: M43 family zinc metalloprotease [Bacteroidia bacterium]|nr:M43 family zinc metalloprotease [Bacteroidia bacterium]
MRNTLLLLFLMASGSFLFMGDFAKSPSLSSHSEVNQVSESLGEFSNSNYCIGVKIHVVKHSDGTEAFATPNNNQIIDNLNRTYNQHGIFFYLESTNTINNTALVDLTRNEFITLIRNDNDAGSLNYYVVNTLWDDKLGEAEGIPNNSLAIRRSEIYSIISVHEVGHCLNLHHTFHGTSAGERDSACIEAKDGSNCQICGDYVCDTPADAQVGFTNGYTPDLTNFMNTNRRDLDHFTPGQVDRMRMALNSNIRVTPYVNSGCSIVNTQISAPNEMCKGVNYTFNLQSRPAGSTLTWEYPSNVGLISQSGSQAVFRLNTYTGSTLKIIARLQVQGTTYYIQKNIKQNQVPSTSLITLESFQNAPLYTNQFNTVTARYDGDIDGGVLGYVWEWVVPSSSIQSQGSSYSYIKVKPNFTYNTSIYIKTRATNGCGTGQYKGKWFPVEYRSGRGRGGIDY